ncbi:hypothetical protein So717_41410 [Roseobacter cerasinus]|uniref:Uncharacterized protein n=1 Tax=Roseobacter cerasinus TaxID=2602289 RepID=A0A640VVF2_9RHOB|nr:hypothetical protein [Roseobacter cerasinus]GFE52388.1 hypothetical protein So717_41410 [Roseobacter cerasinus]
MAPPSYTLADIRAHSSFPFRNWRTEDFEFLMLELYWAERVRSVLGEDMAGFEPLYDTERDGNPILSVTHAGSLRGLRVVVNENDDAKPLYPEATGPDAFYPLYAFLNDGRLPDGETPVNELVLLVSLDERMSEQIDAFIRWHCIEEKSVDEMEALFLRYETDFGQIDPDTAFPDQ